MIPDANLPCTAVVSDKRHTVIERLMYYIDSKYKMTLNRFYKRIPTYIMLPHLNSISKAFRQRSRERNALQTY